MNGSGTGGRLAVGFFCLRPSGVPRCCQVWSVARCTFAPVPGVSMLPGVEYCHGCTFTPCLVPRCCQVWSVVRCTFAPVPGVPRCCQVWSVARCTFAPAGALVGIRHGVLPRLHIYAVPGAPLHHIIHVIQYHSN